MRVLLSTCARGDVKPMVGRPVRLRALGAEVPVCAPPDLADMLARIGVPLLPVGQPVRPLATGETPPSAGRAPARGRVGRRAVRHCRRGGRGM
jgi:vancomycin aglycone glucosyltransferase